MRRWKRSCLGQTLTKMNSQLKQGCYYRQSDQCCSSLRSDLVNIVSLLLVAVVAVVLLVCKDRFQNALNECFQRQLVVSLSLNPFREPRGYFTVSVKERTSNFHFLRARVRSHRPVSR